MMAADLDRAVSAYDLHHHRSSSSDNMQHLSLQQSSSQNSMQHLSAVNAFSQQQGMSSRGSSGLFQPQQGMLQQHPPRAQSQPPGRGLLSEPQMQRSSSQQSSLQPGAASYSQQQQHAQQLQQQQQFQAGVVGGQSSRAHANQPQQRAGLYGAPPDARSRSPQTNTPQQYAPSASLGNYAPGTAQQSLGTLQRTASFAAREDDSRVFGEIGASPFFFVSFLLSRRGVREKRKRTRGPRSERVSAAKVSSAKSVSESVFHSEP